MRTTMNVLAMLSISSALLLLLAPMVFFCWTILGPVVGWVTLVACAGICVCMIELVSID